MMDKILDRYVAFWTPICWWADVRFNKTSVHVSFVFAVIFSMCLFFALDVFVYDVLEERRASAGYDIITNIIFGFAVPCMMFFIFGTKGDLKRSQESPNPNRSRFSSQVIFIMLSIVISSAMVAVTSAPSIYVVYFFVYTLVEVAAYGILCTEPIPPGEKRKRKEQNESKKIVMSPT